MAVSGVITAGFELKPPPYPFVRFLQFVIKSWKRVILKVPSFLVFGSYNHWIRVCLFCANNTIVIMAMKHYFLFKDECNNKKYDTL